MIHSSKLFQFLRSFVMLQLLIHHWNNISVACNVFYSLFFIFAYPLNISLRNLEYTKFNLFILSFVPLIYFFSLQHGHFLYSSLTKNRGVSSRTTDVWYYLFQWNAFGGLEYVFVNAETETRVTSRVIILSFEGCYSNRTVLR